MILSLDHNQRLNLVSMLDMLESVGRREAWAVCALQEKLELTDEERKAIGWQKTQANDGREFIIWNRLSTIEVRDFDLSEDDVRRICHAIDKYPVVLARDKHWWVPLTTQLPESDGDKLEKTGRNRKEGENSNGQIKSQSETAFQPSGQAV